MTWQVAAKGIPVWEGCEALDQYQISARVYIGRWPEGNQWWLCPPMRHMSFYWQDERGDWCFVDAEGPVSVDPPAPNLTDPDTRAAYIRRLAVALGCPGSTADIGVTFQASGDGYECAAGRKITMEGGTFTPWRWHSGGNPRFAVADERVALALAWPADKRVTT